MVLVTLYGGRRWDRQNSLRETKTIQILNPVDQLQSRTRLKRLPLPRSSKRQLKHHPPPSRYPQSLWLYKRYFRFQQTHPANPTSNSKNETTTFSLTNYSGWTFPTVKSQSRRMAKGTSGNVKLILLTVVKDWWLMAWRLALMERRIYKMEV